MKGGAPRTIELKFRIRFSFMLRVERVFKLRLPPSESALASGVNPLIISICSYIVAETVCTSSARFVPMVGMRWPSIVTVFRLPGMPRTWNPVFSPSSFVEGATPGRRIITSPTLMFGRLPKESIATTFFTLFALRCIVSARALPSRSPVTLKASSL